MANGRFEQTKKVDTDFNNANKFNVADGIRPSDINNAIGGLYFSKALSDKEIYARVSPSGDTSARIETTNKKNPSIVFYNTDGRNGIDGDNGYVPQQVNGKWYIGGKDTGVYIVGDNGPSYIHKLSLKFQITPLLLNIKRKNETTTIFPDYSSRYTVGGNVYINLSYVDNDKNTLTLTDLFNNKKGVEFACNGGFYIKYYIYSSSTFDLFASIYSFVSDGEKTIFKLRLNSSSSEAEYQYYDEDLISELEIDGGKITFVDKYNGTKYYTITIDKQFVEQF